MSAIFHRCSFPSRRRRFVHAALLLLMAVFVFTAGIHPALADKRVALVIGNGAYERADRLANPVTDSRNLREALKKIGFNESDIVYGENLNKRDLERAIGRFALLARDADVAIAYYAGHGATFGDTPYLVPIDARFDSIDQMPYELAPLEAMVGELRKARGVRIAIVDACRDNSAERDLKRQNARGGEFTRGLAPPRNPEGLIVAYATQYLSTAADGPAGSDSPFTAALLKYLPTPGLDVKDLFFEVGREVLSTTKGRQRPEVKVSFYDRYSLVTPLSVAPAPSLQNKPALAPAPVADTQQADFDAAMQAGTIAALDAFLAKYSSGPLVNTARRERKRLHAQVVAPFPSRPRQVVAAVAPHLDQMERIGSFGDWGTYSAQVSGEGKTCYALGSPKERQPMPKMKDTPAYVFISTRPYGGVLDEVVIHMGYLTKEDGSARADIDGSGFELITVGGNAWLKNLEKEKEFVNALKGGTKLVVKTSSAYGSRITDTYSLEGLSDALIRVRQECR